MKKFNSDNLVALLCLSPLVIIMLLANFFFASIAYILFGGGALGVVVGILSFFGIPLLLLDGTK